MTFPLFEWSFFKDFTHVASMIITSKYWKLRNKGRHTEGNSPCCLPFLYAKIAAAAKAVAATVEEIGGAIAAGGWVVLVIIAVIIVIFVMIMAVIGHWEFISPLVALETLHPS